MFRMAPAITGQIRKISYGVNPATRLVDVFVSLPAADLSSWTNPSRGELPLPRPMGLIVPRRRSCPKAGASLFTIKEAAP